MKRSEAIGCVLSILEREVVVAANGMISRETYAAKDRLTNFYMLGSMGLASSIALGIAINKPKRKVVVFDGDGNVLMGLGALAMIGSLQPRNFFHFVFDNECYGSTGGQSSISRRIDLGKIASASGYRKIFKVYTLAELKFACKKALTSRGPSFILVKALDNHLKNDAQRIPHSPTQIADRFIMSINSSLEVNSKNTFCPL